MIDVKSEMPLCPCCKVVRLREMTQDDAEDDRIIAGYLICDTCGGEFPEDNLNPDFDIF